jgi:hypothetical protein
LRELARDDSDFDAAERVDVRQEGECVSIRVELPVHAKPTSG